MPNRKSVKETIHIIHEARFHGEYPDVPMIDAIDHQELTEGDDDPVFVTLPLGEVGQESRNGYRYVGDTALQAIHQAIQQERVQGRRGHTEWLLHAEQPIVFQWVGSLIVNETTVWGKAYILPTSEGKDVRVAMKAAKASGAKVSTSIEGTGDVEYNEETGQYEVVSLTVDYIDMVSHPGIEFAKAQPKLTSENKKESQNENPNELEGDMDNENKATESERIATLKEKHRAELTSLKQQLAEAKAAVRERDELVSIITDNVGDTEYPSVVLTEVFTEINELRVENHQLMDATIESMVAESVAIETMRPMIVQRVLDAKPGTRSEARTALNRVLNDSVVRQTMEALAKESLGPAMEKQSVPLEKPERRRSYLLAPEVNDE